MLGTLKGRENKGALFSPHTKELWDEYHMWDTSSSVGKTHTEESIFICYHSVWCYDFILCIPCAAFKKKTQQEVIVICSSAQRKPNKYHDDEMGEQHQNKKSNTIMFWNTHTKKHIFMSARFLLCMMAAMHVWTMSTNHNLFHWTCCQEMNIKYLFWFGLIRIMTLAGQ